MTGETASKFVSSDIPGDGLHSNAVPDQVPGDKAKPTSRPTSSSPFSSPMHSTVTNNGCSTAIRNNNVMNDGAKSQGGATSSPAQISAAIVASQQTIGCSPTDFTTKRRLQEVKDSVSASGMRRDTSGALGGTAGRRLQGDYYYGNNPVVTSV